MSKAEEAGITDPPPAYPGVNTGTVGNSHQPGYSQQSGIPPQQGYPQQPGAPPMVAPGAMPPKQEGAMASYPAAGQPYPGESRTYQPPPGQPYPQPGQPYQPMYQQQQQPQTVVTVTQPGVVAPIAFRDTPVNMTCPHCQAQISTGTHYETGTMTWVVAAGICAAGLLIPFLWCGCCLIPFCINSLKNVVHECPNCHREVGRCDRTRM